MIARAMAVREREIGEVRDYYDRYWSAEHRPHYEPGDILSTLIECNVDASSQCLDVGCGAGETYAQLVRQRADSYTGVDVSAHAIGLARSAGLTAELIDDASELPFHDDSFDVVFCVEVLEHLFSPHRAAEEIRRVLRPGGRLIASAPNVAYWRLRANLLFGLWNPLGDALSIEQPWRDPHVRFFTPSTLRRMLQRAGFGTSQVGAHGGCLLDHLTSRPTNFGVGRVYRRAEARFPALLGLTIHAVATK